MTNNEYVKKLVKQANDKTDWKARLDALNKIKVIYCRERYDVIVRLALHDKVYKVKEEAFRAAQSLGFNYKGNPIKLGKKDIGYKTNEFTKTFCRIKREINMDILDLDEFKNHFKLINPEMYDVMLFEKGNRFDEWIINTFKSLPKK